MRVKIFGFIVVALICAALFLSVTLLHAQGFPSGLPPGFLYAPRSNVPQASPWEIDARSLFSRSALSFHGGQADLKANRTLGEFGATLTVPNSMRIRYSLRTSISGSDNITPSGSLFVGSTDFGKSLTQSSVEPSQAISSASQTPTKIDWTLRPTHTIEIACLRFSPRLRPFFIARRCDMAITGASQETNGQTQKRDTEELKAWLYGLGGEVVTVTPNAEFAARVAGSSKFLFVDLSYSEHISPQSILGFGFQHEVSKFDRDTVLRANIFYLKAGITF